jgi:hypothetical protein
MAINESKAFDVDENGIGLLDSNGNRIMYLTSGAGSPVGSPAPINTWYIDQSSRLIYYKYGALDSEWRQIRAEDIAAIDPDLNPTTVAQELTRIGQGGGTGVAQTLIFGGGGNTSANNYLSNSEVPSNVVGVPVGLTNARIKSVFLCNENTRTGNILVQERFPAGAGTYTTIYTLSITNQSYANVTGLDVPITQNAEIAVFTEVSLKNCKIVVNVNGDSS